VNKKFRYDYLVVFFLFLLFSCQHNKKGITKKMEAIDLVAVEDLYAKGKYCELLTNTKSYLNQPALNTEEWWVVKILAGKSYLELEQWQKVAEWINEFELAASNCPKSFLTSVDLIKARYLEKTEKIAAAELTYQQLFRQTEKLPISPFSTALIAHYGNFQYNLGNYKKAENIIEKLRQPAIVHTAETAKAISTLSNLYKQQSKSLIAEQSFLNTKTILESQNWTEHPTYALFLIDYALSFHYNGQLAKADSLLTLATKINENNCNIPSVAGYTWSAKANIQYALGKIDLAKQFYNKTITAFQSINQHGEVAIATFKLGEVYFAQDSLEKARATYQLALSQINQFVGEKEHVYRGIILQGMAILEAYNWNYPAADTLYEKSRKIIGQTLGEKSTEYATSLTNLAQSKEAQSDYENALKLYRETAHLDTLLQSKYHPNYKKTLFNLARCYSKMDSTAQTLQYYQKGIDLQLRLLNDYFGDFSEATRMAYRAEAMGNFDVFNTYACFTEQEASFTEIQHINLATKNRALDFSMTTRSAILKAGDENLQKDYQLWIKQKELLTKLYLQSEADRQTLGISIDSLQQATNDIEKQLTRSIHSKNIIPPTVQFETIRQALKPEEAAIDYFNVHITDEYGQFPDSIFYFALVTRLEWAQPKLIRLLEGKTLKEILDLSSHYTLNAEVNHLLYQKIWQPLEPHLEGIETVHLSPDGLLHQISFAGLFSEAETDKTLIETYQFKYYSNLGDLIQKPVTIEQEPSMLLMANIDYDKGLNNIDFTSNEYFSPLAGTSKELEYLKKNIALKSFKIQSFEGELATETQFKSHLKIQQPNILHLATHGYFLEKKEAAAKTKSLGERLKNAENNFLRSGLVFSGVNKYWLDTTSIAPEKDGILTALEVANLDLSKTELVVLSACNTGRGALTDGEGIFGLQRAFKMAGAKYILVSLWKIPDTQTAELMNHFYTYLAQTKSPSQSLFLAQKEMQKVYVNPFDWASFVLFE